MEMGFNPILTPTSREERMNLKVIAFALIGTFWGLPALGQNEVCIPLYVDGVTGSYRWETTLVISNQEQTGAEFRLHFYDSNGQTIPGTCCLRRASSQALNFGPAVSLQIEWMGRVWEWPLPIPRQMRQPALWSSLQRTEPPRWVQQKSSWDPGPTRCECCLSSFRIFSLTRWASLW